MNTQTTNEQATVPISNERIRNMKFITRSSPIVLALLLAAAVARAQTSANAATVERLSINNIGANAEFEWVDDS